ncbi:hypothetical protein RHS01_07678 [Rhizoctonia solani]|uniref:DUF4470 domain-containing protein n=1 Tax=Rhizoctonia solani TaxID=456999 RepID=A0A8H7M2Q2_9AGAM|nr:hypothetical protein RHS01_07678 [Rhizoctonia solani]
MEPDPRKIDITCSEKEPAVIARNILVFALLYEKAAIEQIWNIYYHFKIDESTSALLTAHSRKLADAQILGKIHNIWIKYANFPELSNQMLQDIKAKQSKLASAMLKSTGSGQNIRVSRSTTLVWPQSATEVSDEFKRFWRTGTTNKPSSNEDRLNPAWIYSGKNEEWSVYSTSFPEVFHLVEAFLPDKRDPRKKLPTCLDKARQQFKLACESFQVSLRTEKLTLRFYTGDPLCFSLALQSSSELIPQCTDPWDAKPIDLTHHFSLSPPRQFEIIDATRFIDTHGLWNLIIAIQPLLASTKEHEQRVAWVSADPCPPSVPLGVKFSVTDIADALFYIYRGMHFFDDSPEYFEPVPLSRLRVWSQLPYNRETVARIVRHVQSRGQIHLVAENDLHLEDLKLQFQLCDFLPLPNPPTPVGIFAGWSEVPPVVYLVLKIPASANELKVLKDYGESIQPRLTCIIRKSANDNKPQMFSSLHAIWTRINGSSDMIVSFWISSALIAGNETTVSLAFRYTSLSHRLYHRSLGHDLDIFKAQVKDQSMCSFFALGLCRLLLSNHYLFSLLRHLHLATQLANVLVLAGDRWYIKDIIARLDVTDPEEKISLAGGAKVSMQLEGPCRLRLSIGDYTHAVSIPFPAKESDVRLRVARKSSYIETVTTPYQPWYAGGYPPSPFPILLNPPRPWNVHHIPLDKLPLIELSDTEAMETYILPHMALQHSDRERKIMFDPNYVPRDHIHALKVGINILIHDYIDGSARRWMRSDSSGGTIVLDTAIIPVTNENKSTVLPLLDPIGESGVLIMSVDVQHGEMGAWKQYLAACIERVRTWTHKPECEYQAAGQAPISLQDGEDSICACGNGIGFEGKEWIPPEAPKWQQLLPYATRAGVSPIFSVPYLEIVGGEVFKDTGYGRPLQLLPR